MLNSQMATMRGRVVLLENCLCRIWHLVDQGEDMGINDFIAVPDIVHVPANEDKIAFTMDADGSPHMHCSLIAYS